MKIFNKLNHKKSENILQFVENAHLFKRYLFLIVGIIIYAAAYNLFFFKNNKPS